MIKKFDIFFEGKYNQLDYILDKMNKYGKDSLSNAEKNLLKGIKDPKELDAHYNQYISKILSDLKDDKITEEIAKQFIEKYVSKDDLFSVLLQLLKDGKLDHLTKKNL